MAEIQRVVEMDQDSKEMKIYCWQKQEQIYRQALVRISNTQPQVFPNPSYHISSLWSGRHMSATKKFWNYQGTPMTDHCLAMLQPISKNPFTPTL